MGGQGSPTDSTITQPASQGAFEMLVSIAGTTPSTPHAMLPFSTPVSGVFGSHQLLSTSIHPHPSSPAVTAASGARIRDGAVLTLNPDNRESVHPAHGFETTYGSVSRGFGSHQPLSTSIHPHPSSPAVTAAFGAFGTISSFSENRRIVHLAEGFEATEESGSSFSQAVEGGMVPNEGGNITPHTGQLSEGCKSRGIFSDDGNPDRRGSGGQDRAIELLAAGGRFSQGLEGGMVAEELSDITPGEGQQSESQESRGIWWTESNPDRRLGFEASGQDWAKIGLEADGHSRGLMREAEVEETPEWVSDDPEQARQAKQEVAGADDVKITCVDDTAEGCGKMEAPADTYTMGIGVKGTIVSGNVRTQLERDGFGDCVDNRTYGGAPGSCLMGRYALRGAHLGFEGGKSTCRSAAVGRSVGRSTQ